MQVIQGRILIGLAMISLAFTMSCRAAEAPKGDEAQAKSVAVKMAPPVIVVTGAKMPVPVPKIPDKSFSVKDNGAVGDGVADDTAAIQKTIDAAGAAGGGKVLIPAGTYLCGPINLAGGTDLHLAEGATLKVLPLDKYPVVEGEYPAFVTASKVHDIRLSGRGMINGQGETWWKKFRAGELKLKRPRLVYLTRCERVEVTGVHLKDAPMFNLTLNMDTDVTVDGIKITADTESPNTDGIQIKGSNLVIRNCSISNGDDNIVFGGPASDVTIYNCKFGTGHGISMGSYTRNGISNVKVYDCTFDGTEGCLRGKSQNNRGGVVENISYSNITMTNVLNPVYFMSYYEDKNKDPNLDEPQPVTDLTPVWRNISFENIKASTVTHDRRNAGILWGTPEAPIENFVFRNVDITAQKTFKVYHCRNIYFADDVKLTLEPTQILFHIFDATNIRTPDGRIQSSPGRQPDALGQEKP